MKFIHKIHYNRVWRSVKSYAILSSIDVFNRNSGFS